MKLALFNLLMSEGYYPVSVNQCGEYISYLCRTADDTSTIASITVLTPFQYTMAELEKLVNANMVSIVSILLY